jgi:hypothetical protein
VVATVAKNRKRSYAKEKTRFHDLFAVSHRYFLQAS